MNHRSLKTRRAFTLVEMLVVVAIIGLLVAALLPAFGSVRRSAKYAQASAMFNALDQGISLFRGEDALGGGIPPSVPDNPVKTLERHNIADPTKDDGNVRVQGAHLLAHAMIGADGLGAPGFRDLNRDGNWWNDTGNKKCDPSNKGGLYGLSAKGEPCHPRYGGKGGYVDEKMRDRMKSVQELFDGGVIQNQPIATNIAVNQAMFIDPWDTPVLYYRANRAASRVVSTSADPGIYWLEDNGLITGVTTGGLYASDGFDFGAGKLNGTYHDMTDPYSPDPTVTPTAILQSTNYPQSFLRVIWDQSIKARPTPVRPDSYLLISAGDDRRYGTDDDVTNWTREKSQ